MSLVGISGRRRTALALAIACSAALLLAGCGDGRLSKSAYIDKNNDIQTRVQKSTSKIQSSQASSTDAIAKQAGEVKTEIDKAAKDLEALKPPKEWQDEHDDIIEGLKETSAVMAGWQKAAKDKDTAALTKSITQLNAAAAKISKATSSINSSR